MVEGPQDVKFFGDMLLTLESSISVVPVDAVEPPEGGFELVRKVGEHYVELGNRDRVIQLARYEDGDGALLRFLVDRDLDLPNELIQDLPNLLYTDYPAIESYWVGKGGLRWFVRAFDVIDRSKVGSLELRLRAEESTMAALLGCLAGFLVVLFCLRRAHREVNSVIEFPRALGKYRRGEAFPDVVLDTEKLAGVIGLDEEACRDAQAPEVTFEEVRKVAYGHDVAATLWAMFPTLRNNHGIQSAGDLETLLRSQVTPEDVRDRDLFFELVGWADAR